MLCTEALLEAESYICPMRLIWPIASSTGPGLLDVLLEEALAGREPAAYMAAHICGVICPLESSTGPGLLDVLLEEALAGRDPPYIGRPYMGAHICPAASSMTPWLELALGAWLWELLPEGMLGLAKLDPPIGAPPIGPTDPWLEGLFGLEACAPPYIGPGEPPCGAPVGGPTDPPVGAWLELLPWVEGLFGLAMCAPLYIGRGEPPCGAPVGAMGLLEVLTGLEELDRLEDFLATGAA
mmetsp:Transcript_42462/g.104062  ORF Transcript_42462/g.104062 Transcript_42462/m.104062 type:complete len:239 (-) Transcript_42462:561-1277(-)